MSRVRVTCRRSPHKVERVSGLVTRSHVDIPKVSKAKQSGVTYYFLFFFTRQRLYFLLHLFYLDITKADASTEGEY